jgi:GNAT superfamily N-acetyltransferase
VAADFHIGEFGAAEFEQQVDSLLAVYAAAMRPAAAMLPGRRALMRRHAEGPSFRALAARWDPGGPVIGFAYGFRSTAGQWWHDSVLVALSSRAGARTAAGWMADCLEVAELHVHPDHQQRGIGRRLLLTLASGRGERTAMLSTPDQESAARRLYRSVGFSDLLTGYGFPGGGPPYAVMGAPLPLLAG